MKEYRVTNAADEAPVDKPFGWRFTFPLLLGSTLNPINSSDDRDRPRRDRGGLLHTGPGQTATLVSVLYLCSAVMQPTMGKLSTLFGARRIFLIGVAILLLGGAIGAMAPSFGVLLLSRALIGVATSAAYPTAMALVRRRADERGIGVPSRVLGNFSIASQITTVFGLPIGGVLAGAFGWRALFLVNLPLAIITFAFFGVAKDPKASVGDRGGILAAIDLPGIAQSAGLSPLAVGLILLPLSGASIVLARINSNKGWVRWPLIGGAAALILTGVVILFITHSSSILVVSLIGMSVLFGVTNGFSGFANQAALYMQAPAAEIAVAAGLYRTFSYIGAIFSSSLIGIVFGAQVADDGFHRLGWVIIGIGAVSAFLTVLDRRIPVLAPRDKTSRQ